MGFRDLFKDKNHPAVAEKAPLPSNLDVGGEGEQGGSTDTPEETYGLTARVTGDEVNGYRFTIYKNGRYKDSPYDNHAWSLPECERKAKSKLAQLRKKEATSVTKEIV